MNVSSLCAALQADSRNHILATTIAELERQAYSVLVADKYRGSAVLQQPAHILDKLERAPVSLQLESTRNKKIEQWYLYRFNERTRWYGNAASNFIYRFVGADPNTIDLDAVNNAHGKTMIASRIGYLRERGFRLEFVGVENANLYYNLQLIDSCLPQILARCLEYKYAGDSDYTLSAMLEYLRRQNPLGFDLSRGHPFYEYKLKRFLVDAALGMTPAEIWTGEFNATGGIIIVKQDGDVVCYHIYNYNEFENYLLANTRFEQASTSRYHFGDVYREHGELRLKLNLQVRFVN